MIEKLKKPIRLKPVLREEESESINREIIPALKEIHERVNDILTGQGTYLVTNVFTERRTFDTTTVTLPQLAEVVATLIRDLRAKNQIG